MSFLKTLLYIFRGATWLFFRLFVTMTSFCGDFDSGFVGPAKSTRRSVLERIWKKYNTVTVHVLNNIIPSARHRHICIDKPVWGSGQRRVGVVAEGRGEYDAGETRGQDAATHVDRSIAPAHERCYNHENNFKMQKKKSTSLHKYLFLFSQPVDRLRRRNV